MARTPRLYEKLLGWRGSMGSRTSLWLAADHVLLVEANMMTERYQRVWLRDMQGFFVRPSREARWATGVGAGLVLLFGILAMALDVDVAFIGFFWAMAVIGLAGLLFGLFAARTHHFYAVTAVQRTEWPNVARRRHIRKLLKRLEPLVRAAQQGEPSAVPVSTES